MIVILQLSIVDTKYYFTSNIQMGPNIFNAGEKMDLYRL